MIYVISETEKVIESETPKIKDGGYWQTVMVCQLEVIGRPYGLPIRDYWQTVYKISKRSVNNLLLADPWCSAQKSNYYSTVQTMVAMRVRLSDAISSCSLHLSVKTKVQERPVALPIPIQ